ncbi:peptidase [Rhodococcus hoagii]|uniref:DUF2268 domain-containing protein n=2 Tax=Corynebacterium TaxID=1716 RepID=A0A0B6TUX3_9CORY|nr:MULTISPECIES: DUF2268 domain-containing putative Zn-dependent protease [Actinomycetes]NKR90451.1 peptidase [Prescottella equi]AJK70089.1 hypothetical protein B840_12605 [Corynebacterium marinum DSM 44953]NKR90482.1 peptidase [Prescottella equi]NKS05209.1 peptidase [Prescottella equi]NKS87002.1 peptidase [Prescottella equi]
MNIDIIDTAAAMTRVFDVAPEHRRDLIRKMWSPMNGMYHFVPGEMDLAVIHKQNFGFPENGPEEELRESLDTLIRANAWERMHHALERGIETLKTANPDLHIPDLKVLLLLGDPTNRHFMEEVKGLSAFGGISGYIVISVWPTIDVLNRLEAIVVHELHHNVRYSPGGVVWDPVTVTVGEHVVAEGLADVFATELYGSHGYTHFVDDQTRNDDSVLAKVASGLQVTGMQDFAAWVLGDKTAQLFGAEPVGLPTGAGYAAGVRLVSEYLHLHGGTAASNVHTPVETVLSDVLPRLGLGDE